MKALSGHHYIIRYVDSYIMDQQLAIIVESVARPGSLAVMLHHIQKRGKPNEEESRILFRSFGCLASDLAFIHGRVIRLKDIKPENILVDGEEVIYADFGVAFDASNCNTTTEGIPFGFTRRYCAPEVMAQSPRNRKSDIFSLGCVYCDVLSVLDPEVLPPATLRSCYDQNTESIRRKLLSIPDMAISAVCHSMLDPINGQRPTAAEVVRHFRTHSNSIGPAFFCYKCSLG